MAEEQKDQRAGFEIENRFYPMPESYRLCDPVLVTELTGLTWAEFVDALDDEDRMEDPVVLLGIIAAAVWQQHPRWTRDRATRYVGGLDIGAVRATAPEPEVGDPPALPAEVPATSSEGSPETSSAPPESPSAPIPPSSGAPESATGSPESALMT